MAKKVFLGVGHGGSDPGAVKYLIEKDVNLNMALACRDELARHGVQVRMSRTKDENDTLQQEIAECNAFAPDLAVDIHDNAGGGDGFEAYYHIGGGLSKTLAQNIEAEVKKIGQNSRGIKTKVGNGGTDYFGFIRETVCPAIICEGVFVDNKKDAAQADTLKEQQAFGVAYAKGILKTLGIAYKEPTAEKKPAAAASSGKTYKVQVGAYKSKANAEAQLAKIKKAGFDAVIVTG
jgi:N-acetylmuramoyl-L-alanine amidase